MVTKQVYRNLLIFKLLPVIMEKWLRRDRLSRKIFIQQDGVKNHISENDKEFNDALTEKDINTKLYMQAANSPDINLLDLGFFRAIRSFNDTTPKNEEELIELVSMAYNNYPRQKINRTWFTLQCRFNQFITHNGDNNYNIDHIMKEKLEQLGKLPDIMDVVEEVDCVFNSNDTEDETENETKDDSDDENTITPT